MTIRIGEKVFETEQPANLDDLLLAQTGCNATEARRWLKGNPAAGYVAMALRPWLTGDDLPTMADLGAMIADVGAVDVASQLADLYDPPQPEPWAPPPVEDEASPQ